jgi:hypothetical protein
MKKILALATSMFLVLGIATASFAAPKTDTKKAPAQAEKTMKTKTAKVKKTKKHKKAAKAATKTEGATK